jgi:SmpA / OmlA family
MNGGDTRITNGQPLSRSEGIQLDPLAGRPTVAPADAPGLAAHPLFAAALRRLVAAVAMLVAASAFVLWPRPDRISREKVERITVGMNRADVEAILGRPPDGESLNPSTVYDDAYPTEQALESAYVLDWADGDETICVGFDNQGAITEVRFLSEVPPSQGFLESFLWRLKRPWRRCLP